MREVRPVDLAAASEVEGQSQTQEAVEHEEQDEQLQSKSEDEGRAMSSHLRGASSRGLSRVMGSASMEAEAEAAQAQATADRESGDEREDDGLDNLRPSFVDMD